MIQQDVGQRVPNFAELSVEVPSAALAMDVDDQVEEQLEYLERVFGVL